MLNIKLENISNPKQLKKTLIDILEYSNKVLDEYAKTTYVDSKFITKNEAATKADIQNVENDMLLMRINIDGISSTANEAFSIAKGANKAIGVENYEELVDLLKREPDFVVGQSFYVKTLNVPDMWIYSVEDSGVNYTYVDDASIIAATTEAPLQIGPYKIAQLETLKTDLTNYVKNTDVSKKGELGLMALYGETNGWGYGLYNYGGRIYVTPATYTEINSRYQMPNAGSALSNPSNFKPITRATIDYAVKKVLTEDKLATTDYAWTDEEKALARANLGITSDGSGTNIEIDTELSTESENPVQNKVITEELNSRVLKGETAPTTETVGSLGQLYEDTATGDVYQCKAVADGVYTWAKMINATDVSKKGKPGLLALYGDSNGWGYGLYNNNGRIYLLPAGYAQLNARNPESNPSSSLNGTNKFRPITNATIDYAVKKVLVDNKLATTDYAWTDEEKATVRANLGITGGGTQLYRHRITVDYAIDSDGNTEQSYEIAFLSKRSTPFTNDVVGESFIGIVDGIFEYKNVYRVTVVNNRLFFILSIGGDLSNGEFIFDGLSTSSDGMIYLENPKQETVGQDDNYESIYGVGYFMYSDSFPYENDTSTCTITDVVTKY